MTHTLHMPVSRDIYRRHVHRLPTPLCDWTSDGRRFQATNICRNVTHHTRPQSSETPLSEHQTCVFCEVRTQLVHFTETDIAFEGVKTDRRSDACSAQACTSFRDCTCLTRVGVVDSLRAAHSDYFQKAISDCSHRTTAVRSTAMLQNTYTVQLPRGTSQRRPSAWPHAHVIPTVLLFVVILSPTHLPERCPKLGHRVPPYALHPTRRRTVWATQQLLKAENT